MLLGLSRSLLIILKSKRLIVDDDDLEKKSPTLPHLAQGAAQAFEDAETLAVVLSKVKSKSEIPGALLVYDVRSRWEFFLSLQIELLIREYYNRTRQFGDREQRRSSKRLLFLVAACTSAERKSWKNAIVNSRSPKGAWHPCQTNGRIGASELLLSTGTITEIETVCVCVCDLQRDARISVQRRLRQGRGLELGQTLPPSCHGLNFLNDKGMFIAWISETVDRMEK
jgi:hypothetical protein